MKAFLVGFLFGLQGISLAFAGGGGGCEEEIYKPATRYLTQANYVCKLTSENKQQKDGSEFVKLTHVCANGDLRLAIDTVLEIGDDCDYERLVILRNESQECNNEHNALRLMVEALEKSHFVCKAKNNRMACFGRGEGPNAPSYGDFYVFDSKSQQFGCKSKVRKFYGPSNWDVWNAKF